MADPFLVRINLLACDWGRRIATADYPHLCPSNAVERICLHGENGTRLVQLCAPHRDFVLMETTPHGKGAAL